jgi:hypothetical protein
MSRNAEAWRALCQLAQAETPAEMQALDRLLALTEGVQAAADAGDLDGAAALLDDFTGQRLVLCPAHRPLP